MVRPSIGKIKVQESYVSALDGTEQGGGGHKRLIQMSTNNTNITWQRLAKVLAASLKLINI